VPSDLVDATTMRCIDSVPFGIEAHETPVARVPWQPSHKDGLGLMSAQVGARRFA
jgi:hypothetical protein